MVYMITGTFFYADFSVRSFFCLKRGDEFHTFVNSITDAAGGCVLKEKVCEIFFFRQRTEAGQDNPWSAFFHLDRDRIYIECAGVLKGFRSKAYIFACHIIQIAGDT